jgi:hypothetical protein
MGKTDLYGKDTPAGWKPKPLIAHFRFKKFELRAEFDNPAEAHEWGCIRLDMVGERFEKFAYLRIEWFGALWIEVPPQQARRLP